MNMTFDRYARYYDAIYQDKDYEGECTRIETLANHWGRLGKRRILDAGCGTGKHAMILSRQGHDVVGVDRSEAMLAVARANASEGFSGLRFVTGDIRSLVLDQTFDLVTCLSAAIGYQLTTDDILATLQAFRRHLSAGGLLMFDCWNGLAVLTVGPSVRVLRVPMGTKRLIRIATPLNMDVVAQTNTTEYMVIVLDGQSIVDEIHEAHRVRYFFPQELQHLLQVCGFELVHLSPGWESEAPLNETSWTSAVVAKAI